MSAAPSTLSSVSAAERSTSRSRSSYRDPSPAAVIARSLSRARSASRGRTTNPNPTTVTMFDHNPRTESIERDVPKGARAVVSVVEVSEDSESSSPSSSNTPLRSNSPTLSNTTVSSSNPEAVKVGLPTPFYPPTLLDSDETPAKVPDLAEEEGQKDEGLPRVPREKPVSDIAAEDVGTPDAWIKRDTRLVRLTGKHPFNCEARIGELFDAGFLTPTSLFYVRNHGAVPKVDKKQGDEWRFEVTGLVEKTMTLSIQDLIDKFETVTLPVTLVCAGNRRKEQNMVRKGLGFNWGAGGVSNALFTGIYLADLLEAVKPTRKAKHVIFEGGDSLPDGPYGTSQRLSWAKDKNKGMLICWAMNGQPLEPDHGYPLRIVIPGQIGGRSVKWLKKIEISENESQHHLHFWDNKVLPTEVMPEMARSERHWWYDPRYMINDLNVNSAIAYPNHNEVLPLPAASGSSETTYSVRGYAYAGGGRRITRVELSFGEGDTWKLAELNYPEDLYRAVCVSDPVYGRLDLSDRDTCFAWSFWKYDIPVSELSQSSAIMVRAMDESLALQQRDMYWNATGMMNNWWFRIAIHKEQKDGTESLRFEHPTLAGVASGGWMERMLDNGEDILKPVFDVSKLNKNAEAKPKPKKKEVAMTKEGVNRKITLAELKAHNKEEEPWFVVNGQVYDGTAFLPKHPGGAESITLVAGEDASEDFMAIHSPDAKAQLAEFHIGTLVPSDGSEATSADDDGKIDATFLHKSKWKQAKLVQIDSISHDSRVFRFELQSHDQSLGLPVGQHVYVRLRRKVKDSADSKVVEGEMVQRAYTPVSPQNATGFIDLLIKLYLPNTNFPAGGKMTVGFNELEVGDSVELKGPLGSFIWQGKGVAKWKGQERRVKNVGMICGGSGITPILQVLRGILHDEEDKDTKIWLLNGNKTFEDILCRDELHELHDTHGIERYKLHHTLGTAPEGWSYSTGRMNEAMLKQHMPPLGDETLILICGPDGMIEGVKKSLTNLGWDVPNTLVVF